MPTDDLDAFCREALVAERPITVRRRVSWSDCDPAGVVYSGRFFDYAASAYFWFIEKVLVGQGLAPSKWGLEMPMKAYAFEFSGMLRPDDWFAMSLVVAEVRTRSLDLVVAAEKMDGRRLFDAKISPIFVHAKTKVSTAIPDEIRVAITTYQELCETP